MVQRVATTVMLVAVALVAAEARAVEPAVGQLDGTVLLVIDVQEFYFAGGFAPLVGPDEASRNAEKLLQAFRAAKLPVIHVQHLPKGVDVPDPTGVEPQYRIHPDVLPVPGETVIGKHYANAFRETELEEELRALGMRRIVICGMQTHMCVEATVRAAADLGFEVVVAHDACATRDLEFGGVRVPAAQVHAAALAAMNGSYARVAPTAELCGSAP